MMWQDVVLCVVAGAGAHALWVREVARRRRGLSIRDAVLPKRCKPEEPPSVTEVA